MSYCPADGRILGTGIKPATPETVDQAVQAAANAQVEWARTTFAERRQVLRTLLKYVDWINSIFSWASTDNLLSSIDTFSSTKTKS